MSDSVHSVVLAKFAVYCCYCWWWRVSLVVWPI